MKDYIFYISGQITGLTIEEYELLFHKAEMHLRGMGVSTIVNPVKIVHNHDLTWESYMLKDIEELFKCNAIYMLDNWENSRGARIEHFIAKEKGMKVYYQNPTDRI